MRGDAVETDAVFRYMSAQRVPKDHPLRIVGEITDAALQRRSRDFRGAVLEGGTAVRAPERLLRALLLQTSRGGSGGGRARDFRGEKRSSDTHQSTTNSQTRLYGKVHSAESKVSYLGHVVIESRNGLVVGCMATQATGRAECEATVELMGAKVRATRCRV